MEDTPIEFRELMLANNIEGKCDRYDPDTETEEDAIEPVNEETARSTN